jgi:uncharacterized coiled-coil DUF342 family protein
MTDTCPTCSYWKTEAESQRKRADRNLKLVVQRDGEIKELCERIHDRDQKIQELAAEIESLKSIALTSKQVPFGQWKPEGA